jgi:nucleotide-binding universal stress UspA family protein
MKQILVPTDFSNNAYTALLYTTKLYGDEPVQFVLLHSFANQVSALTSRVDIGKSEKVMDTLYDQADTEGAEFVDRLRNDVKNDLHTFEVISTSMSLVRATNKLIEDRGMHLVVMGTKGRTAAEDVLLGSNTIAVVRKIRKAPLLIVPREIEFLAPTEIAFATDYNEAFPTVGIDALLQLVQSHQATLHIVHVGNKEALNDRQQSHLNGITTVLKDIKTQYHWLEEDGSIAKTIDTFVVDQGMDVLAMVYRKRTVIEQWFREAVVKKIGQHTSVPYIVIPLS